MTPRLEHLNVWWGTPDDVAVDYAGSLIYLIKHLGIQAILNNLNNYDSVIVRGMVTRCLVIDALNTQLFELHSTALFRQLQDLEITCPRDDEKTPILPFLGQINSLVIWGDIIPSYPLNIDLPMIYTLQRLRLAYSAFSWMLGRSFKALREFQVDGQLDNPKVQSRHEGLRIDLPACTTLKSRNLSVNDLRFLSCPNVQILQLHFPQSSAIHEPALKVLYDFICNCPRLQNLEILIFRFSAIDSFLQFVFYDARKHGVWRNMRNAEVGVRFPTSSRNDEYRFFNQAIGHRQNYEKWWKECTVTREDSDRMVVVSASI